MSRLNVGAVGYGLMQFTCAPNAKLTQAQYNAVLKEVIDKRGYTEPLFVNGGEFYGIPDRHENLEKLGGFFESYPQYADNVYVSIKGGVDSNFGANASYENIKANIEVINQYLEPLYKARKQLPAFLDMYTLARVDAKRPIEDVMLQLAKYIEAGTIGAICLSEVSAATIAKAAKVHPIAAVEIEYSLWSREPESNGVFAELSKLGIPAVCYSPLGRGLLTGKLTPDDVPAGDIRNRLDRFRGEVWEHNRQLVAEATKIAAKAHLTLPRFALSWITTKSDSPDYPQLIPIPGSTKAVRQLENLNVVKLSPEIMKEYEDFASTFEVKGYRYNEATEETLYR